LHIEEDPRGSFLGQQTNRSQCEPAMNAAHHAMTTSNHGKMAKVDRLCTNDQKKLTEVSVFEIFRARARRGNGAV
jgi:hypothetical protein